MKKLVLTLVLCLVCLPCFALQVKILDVIELEGENKIHVKFIGLDDEDNQITVELNKKFEPDCYSDIEDIKTDLIISAENAAAPNQAIVDLKKLKGKKIKRKPPEPVE